MTTATTQSHSKKVPKLRFPGFSSSWKSETLKNLLEFKNGVNASKEQYGRGYKFINVLDIIENDYLTYDRVRGSVDITKEEYSKNIVSYGDILFQRSSETREEVGQAIVYLDNEKEVTFGGFVIRGKRIGEYVPAFLNYLLQTKALRKDITSRSGGSTRYNIGQESLEKVAIVIPEEGEQQKIADILTLTDAWIKGLRKQKIALESYKKGLVHKIFTQEIRFKDDNGMVFPKWSKKALGTLIEEVDEKTTETNRFPLLSSTIKGIYLQSDYFTRDIASDDTTGYKILKKDQLVFSPQNLWLGNINICSNFEVGIVSPSYKIFRVHEDVVSIGYFKNLIKVPRMLYEYETSSEQGASVVRRNLNMDLFNSISVSLPTIPEQKKIATLFESVDKVIELKDQQITKADLWKRGLIQQLFI